MEHFFRWAWSFACASAVFGAVVEARGELSAHWEFEADAPFDDAVARMRLNPESSGDAPEKMFSVIPGKAPQLKEGKASLAVPNGQGIDLRLRVNAPTRGGNPFRLSGNSWTLTGWFQHSGVKPSAFGSTIAGTHGYSTLEGRGFAGWSLRVIGEGEGEFKLSAVFSSGGAEDVMFLLNSEDTIETGEGKWNFFGLTWEHDGGRGGTGEAQLFVNGRAAGKVEAPSDFIAAEADRNGFRGIWIAGRPTSEKGNGADNWAGRLDDVKFYTDTVADEAVMAATYGPEAMKEPAPKKAPEPAVVAEKKPVEPEAEPKPAVVAETELVEPKAEPKPAIVAEKEPVEPKAEPKPAIVAETEPVEPKAALKPAIVAEKEPVEPKAEPKPAVVAETEPVEPKAEPKPVTVAVAVAVAEKLLAARTWTDTRGKTMEASLVVPSTPVEGRVLLQTADGIRLSLPMERLSEADRAYVGSQ